MGTSEDFEMQLGRVAHLDAFLHRLLEGVIWEVCEMDRDRGAIVTGEIPSQGLVRAACALTNLVCPHLGFEPTFRTRLTKAEEDRNRLLHSNWMFPFDEEGDTSQVLNQVLGVGLGEAIRQKYDRKGTVTSEAVTLDQIRSIADTLQRLVFDLGDWVQNLIGEERLKARFITSLEQELRGRTTRESPSE